MDPFEISEILESFEVIVDTREQATPKAQERYAAIGVPVRRATLSYGDYCASVRINGADLYTENPIKAPCVIERKMNLDELAGCLGRSRDRFKREFERAQAAGAKTYLLVEDGSWEGIIQHRYRSQFRPAAFLASLTAWCVRYDLSIIFCRSATSGKLIREILYRDIKERLERGEYDEREGLDKTGSRRNESLAVEG